MKSEELNGLDDYIFLPKVSDVYHKLCELHVLSERLLDITAKNAVTAAMFDLTKLRNKVNGWVVPSSNAVRKVYEETPDGSSLRRLLADLWTNVPAESFLSVEMIDNFPKELYRDVILALSPDSAVVENVAIVNGVSKYLEKVEKKQAVEPGSQKGCKNMGLVGFLRRCGAMLTRVTVKLDLM